MSLTIPAVLYGLAPTSLPSQGTGTWSGHHPGLPGHLPGLGARENTHMY